MAWELRERKKRRRGMAGQLDRRAVEREVRKSALATARWIGHGAADRIGLAPSTLGGWEKEWREDRMALEARGRKPDRGDAEMRNLVIAVFHLAGDGVGLAGFQELFPDLSRRELEDLHRRYHDIERRRNRTVVHVLRWKLPGRVWAADFTWSPEPVDGTYARIFLVRDLASGVQLLALPVEGETSFAVRAAMEMLFREFGPPLVLKHDNGSGFMAEETAKLLAEWGVTALPSPPYLPEYNGSIEAGVGSVKTRAHHESARHDRAGRWTCDDVEAARLQANETPRWWEPFAPTPENLWRVRRPLTPDERTEFLALVAKTRDEARASRGWLPGVEIGSRENASVDREAISRSLVASGNLEFRRRRIPLPVSSANWRKIS